MKKITLIALSLMIATCGLFAQNEKMVLDKVGPEKVPSAVVKAVKADYPEVEVTEYNLLPASAYEGKMITHTIETEPDESSEQLLYMIYINEKGRNINVIYDPAGDLVQISEKVKNESLPQSITEYIKTEYPGYSVDKDKEQVRSAKDGVVDHYVIKINKDKWVKKLYFNGKGEFIKVKDE